MTPNQPSPQAAPQSQEEPSQAPGPGILEIAEAVEMDRRSRMAPEDTPAEGANRYGVDVGYFRRELAALSASLGDRPPDELARYLQTLAATAATGASPAPEPPIEKAAREFARAWASWHDHSGLMLDDDLSTASNGILEALGLELVEGEDGKHTLSGLPQEGGNHG